jgi:hypothetical protein
VKTGLTVEENEVSVQEVAIDDVTSEISMRIRFSARRRSMEIPFCHIPRSRIVGTVEDHVAQAVDVVSGDGFRKVSIMAILRGTPSSSTEMLGSCDDGSRRS